MQQRILSGITPSGRLTLGNYLGALRRFAEISAAPITPVDHPPTFFVADLHALTSSHEPERLRVLTAETARLFLASGVDPGHSTVFVQSHVTQHVELAYLLECTAYVGELGRMIQFKEKGGLPRTRASLFTYPCLMAADILLYDTDSVPVGADQGQHVELARDLATRFNRLYGDTFVVPGLAPAPTAARVADLVTPTTKMSKSAPENAAGVIRMLDPPELIRRKVTRATTDSEAFVRFDPVASPGVSNLLDILAACTGGQPGELAGAYSSYGRLKRDTADAVVATLEPVQRRHAELLADAPYVEGVLRDGAIEATGRAAQTVDRARRAIGLA